MAPFDKHHREYRATTESPASDWVCDDVLLPEGEPEAELPYYVEVAGDFCVADEPASPRDHLTIRGSDGWIDYDGTTLTLSRERAGAPVAHVYDADAVYADSYAAVIREFADNVRTGASMEAALAANLETLELVEEAYRVAVRRTRA